MSEENKVDYVKQSLLNQIAELSLRVAECERVITEQQIELTEYREKEMKELSKED